jgi:hypothetical protein
MGFVTYQGHQTDSPFSLLQFTRRSSDIPSCLPPRKVAKIPLWFRLPGAAVGEIIGHGPKHVYLDVQACPPDVAYPPRPVSGSIADLDLIMDLCNFPSKYCLEVLHIGGGLDNGVRLQQGTGGISIWKMDRVFVQGTTGGGKFSVNLLDACISGF